MEEEYKTTHGIAKIILPDNADKDRLDASRDLADRIDEFCWKGGAANLSVNTDGSARIHWKLTTPSMIEYNGEEYSLLKLENAENKACTVDCAAFRNGNCYFFRKEKLNCSRLKIFYDEQCTT